MRSWELRVADEMSVSIGKDELLWLVASQCIHTRNHCIRHWNRIPTSPNDFLSTAQSHKFESAMQISARSQTDSSFCSGPLTVAWGIFFVHLTVLSDLET
jgi:hypothetical protein